MVSELGALAAACSFGRPSALPMVLTLRVMTPTKARQYAHDRPQFRSEDLSFIRFPSFFGCTPYALALRTSDSWHISLVKPKRDRFRKRRRYYGWMAPPT